MFQNGRIAVCFYFLAATLSLCPSKPARGDNLYTWNISNLYTTGEVTLCAVPEPETVGLIVAGLLSLLAFKRLSKYYSPRPFRERGRG